MQVRNVPATGPRYWAAISVASVFGANLGDFCSHVLHLGHYRGLAPLALLFAGVLLLERRARPGNQTYYWFAIVILRTAATNLADLATHDLKLGYVPVIAALAAMLVILLAVSAKSVSSVPTTDGRYWTAMLVAGTFGTALGDALADDVGLGAAGASLPLTATLVALFIVRANRVTAATYWLTIVAVRTAGTTVGDVAADGFGLAPSTLLTGVLLTAVLVLWKPQPRVVSLHRA